MSADSNYKMMLTLYEEMLACLPDVQRKGKANPYTSMNGNMYTFLSKGGKISLRLAPDVLKQVTEEHAATPSIQYGAVMQEYAEIPPSLISDREKLANYFKLSYDYAQTLKPKPTKKSK